MRRIPEIIDIVTFGIDALNHLGIVRIPPAGGDIDAGHKEYDCYMRRYDISIKTSFPSFHQPMGTLRFYELPNYGGLA